MKTIGLLPAATFAAALALASVTPAGAITDTLFKYTTPKQGVLTLSTMAFVPDGSTTAANPWYNAWIGNALVGDGCFNTGINLPNGAKITQFRVIYTKGVIAELVATEQSSGADAILAYASRSHANAVRTGFNVDLSPVHTVQTGKYQYGVGVCIVPGQTFNGIRILYTYDSAGD